MVGGLKEELLSDGDLNNSYFRSGLRASRAVGY